MKPQFIFIGQLLFSLLMLCLIALCFGIALIPAVFLLLKSWQLAIGLNVIAKCALIGLALSSGYMLFGVSLLLLVGLTRMILCLQLREGNYPLFSWPTIKWACASVLSITINLAFADFILLTPFMNLLLRMFGAKLGKNVQINSKYIFDPTLLEIGDNTLIGGWAFITGHVVENGVLKLKKVVIGKNVTIGTHAKIMPGCIIGDNAIIGADSVLLKNTKVAPQAVYFGIPAKEVKP